MRLRYVIAGVLAGALFLTAPAFAAPATAPALPKVLVLYDTTGPYGHLGLEYATFLRNLLGHFDVTPVLSPVSNYDAVRDTYRETFYIGSTYEERAQFAAGSPQAQSYTDFLADVARGLPTTWIGLNLWNLAWSWDPAWGSGFIPAFGFSFDGLVDRQFDRVSYKNVVLDKGVIRHVTPGADTNGCTLEAATGFYDCSTMIGQTTIQDPARASVSAWTTSEVTGARAPYAVHGGSLWYIADMPFSYVSEEDRYFAFCDLLHDMLSIPHAESHRGLVRLEDVSPTESTTGLQAAASVLGNLAAPFSVATIPFYDDPTGFYSGGVAEHVRLRGSAVGKLLDAFEGAGASIIQHGTTHQWEGGPNPYNQVTGDDFEFYRVTESPNHALTFVGGIPGDSTKWAIDRVTSGRRELTGTNLSPVAFEPPHYAMSEIDAKAVLSMYPAYYGRSLYFPTGSGRFIGQLFPYMVKDMYGRTVIPEDLGDISPDAWNGYPATTPADLIRHAGAARVVRDGFASFFFHPYLDPSLLDQTVRGISSLGYQFVRACALINNCAPTTTTTTKKATTTYRGSKVSSAGTAVSLPAS